MTNFPPKRSLSFIEEIIVPILLLMLLGCGGGNGPEPKGPPSTASPSETPAPSEQRELSHHALLIGIGRYSDGGLGALRFASADARAYEKLLSRRSGPEGPLWKTRVLLDSRAGKKDILSALNEMGSRPAAAGDEFLLYFSGMGTIVPRPGGSEPALIPCDARRRTLAEDCIPLSELAAEFEKLKGGRVTVILDTSFSPRKSGKSAGKTGTGRGTGRKLPEILGENVRLAAAGGGSGNAFEGNGFGMSLFTYCLLEGLREEADSGGDGVVTWREMSRFLPERVRFFARMIGFRQEPVVRFTHGSDPFPGS